MDEALVTAAVKTFDGWMCCREPRCLASCGCSDCDDERVAVEIDAGTNLDSVFGLVQAAAAQMQRQQRVEGQARGHLVLVSSTAGQRGEAFHADYAASKGALISMTKDWRRSWLRMAST